MRYAFSKVISVLCAVVVVVTLARVILAWGSLPNTIPVHYGFDGQIDEWGSKTRIFVVPVLLLVLHIGIEIVERHPKWWNTSVKVTSKNRDGVYRAAAALLASMKAVLVVSLSAVSAVQVGGGAQPWFLFPAIILALAAVVIFWIVRLRRLR